MFTGIIEDIGTIETIGGHTISILTRLEDIRQGDSISVNGVCLTATDITPRAGGMHLVRFDYSPETVKRTSLDASRSGSPVNLERALKMGDRLGGHMVTGHVEGTGVLLNKIAQGDFILITISLPAELRRYVASKGSIAVDGISLTVVSVTDDSFTVSVIPHTIDATVLKYRSPGDAVNLEADIIAKYIDNIMNSRSKAPVLTEEFLKQNGF